MHLQLRLFLLAIMVSREGAAQSFGVVAGQIIDTSKGVITNASILLENEAN